MKVKIKKEILIKHLDNVVKGLSNKNLIPILNCLKIDLNNEGMYLTSTNNDIIIKTFIPEKEIEEILETGTIVITGRLFYEYIKKLEEDIILLEELIENKLRIFTPKAFSDINCNDKNDFPNLDFSEKKSFITINSDLLKKVINKTIYASATSEDRPILTGLNLKINKDEIICTATDSYRIATKKISLKNKIDEEINCVIPAKNLQELVKILENNVADVELHVYNNRILFKTGDLYFISRLINGNFPNINEIVKNQSEIDIKVNLNNLYHALDRTTLLAREENKQTVSLCIEEDQLKLKAVIPEIGKVEEIIELDEKGKEKFEISFSARYMMDSLRNVSGDSINLSFKNAIAPIIVRSDEEEDYIQLFQPIRTY